MAVGDTITIAAGTVQDATGTNDATGSPPSISGTFSRDTLTISATNAAPTTFDIGAGDIPLLKLTLSVDSNNVTVTQFTITLTGSVTPSDFARSGLQLVSDENGSGTIDAGDLTLGSVNVTRTTVTLPATVAVTSGGSTTVLTPYDSRPRQWSAAQSERKLSSVSAVAVSGADVVAPDPFPLKSNEVTLVGLEPTIIVALAVDASSAGADVQTGDHMILIFSAATNGFGITATNIDTTLIVSASHTWLSGSGAIVGAI